MSGIRKFSVTDLTVIAIRCTTEKEIVGLEDFLLMEMKEENATYDKHQVSPIFSIISGKKRYFANGN
jgi:hypothetical protein